MILSLFIFFIALSIILITLGIIIHYHSELALIGFLFMFLLSFTIMNNNLQYKIGEFTNYSYIGASAYINETWQTDIYTPYNDTTGLFNTQRVGFYLAVASVIGFTGVLMALGKKRKEEEE